MQLMGTADYLNGQIGASALFGMSPAQQSKAAGQGTPPVTAAGGDRQMVPWSADSPGFWAVVVIALTAAGMIGADVRVRMFRRQARAQIGDTT